MKFMEFIKAYSKEVKLASITFLITLILCFGGFFLANKTKDITNESSISLQNTSVTYVGSKNSDKYHLPTCKWVQNIKKSNKITFSTENKAKLKGYTACKTCL